jgi:pimeloyl-ACP methyl ester carboxylesterase
MELVFDRRGSGEPLVLLHGIGSRWQVFAPVLDALARHHEVWAVDMPGFGASPPLPAGRRADIRGLTDAVAEWMGEQGLERPHVAGNSTGGGIALELASRDAVASATALAPIGFWSRRERQFCQASLRLDRTLFGIAGGLAGPALSTAFGRKLLLSQTFSCGDRLSHEEAMDTVEAFMGAASFDETLAAFTGYVAPASATDHAPVTIVWGDRDYLLLSRQARRARRLLPRARHVMVEGAGHVVMNDAPEACVDSILATTRSAAKVPA